MELLTIPLHLRKYWQVFIQKFPGWLKDHVNAFSRVINEVPEYNSQAFECMSLQVEELFGIRLDYLQENGHPLIESVV